MSDAEPISDGQRRRLWAIARERGRSEDYIRSVLMDETGQDSTTGIPRDRYDAVVTAIEAGPAADHEAAGGGTLFPLPEPAHHDVP